MQVFLLKSKIHRAAVTGGDVNYEGSLTIDQDWMDEVGLVPYERILCSNMANGNRFETYAIPGKRGAGEIILNGAAAHLGKTGDLLTIMSFAMVPQARSKRWAPRILVPGERAHPAHRRGPSKSLRLAASFAGADGRGR